ncbi:hypothetical protein Taro_031963 [Colocasia esculenta]|uniref:DELLA protein n=1 Tax=Colocasia esculenta TaxID=4460 RepID=A0A843VK51_COLES|nr:hypothetical protein [Colocasia esculenta]
MHLCHRALYHVYVSHAILPSSHPPGRCPLNPNRSFLFFLSPSSSSPLLLLIRTQVPGRLASPLPRPQPPPWGRTARVRPATAGAVATSRAPPAPCPTSMAFSPRPGSSDLRHVAQRLERLESAMVGGAGPGCSGSAAAQLDQQQQQLFLPADAVHYNPSDLAAWVDSMLSEISLSQSDSNAGVPGQDIPPCQPVDDLAEASGLDSALGTAEQLLHGGMQQAPLPPVMAPQPLVEEEDSGIRLVHILMTCAEAVQRGDAALAGALIEEMRPALARVGTRFGIGKVAGYFIDALSRRLYSPPRAVAATAAESEVLYHHFYEACPYLKFAHFTANQAILEAFDGHDRVHVIDFNLMQGLQWPALIQALALRPGGPPALRLTGIGPPSHDGRDTLRDVGFRLAELARSVGVPFAFRGVAANRLDDVRPWMLQVTAGEAVAVNSVMQLHRLLGDSNEEDAAGGGGPPTPIESVLAWIRGLRPEIVAVVEQEANHNKAAFLDRFTEALFYYSSMFDSLEGGAQQQHMGIVVSAGERAAAEAYLQREICNIVCCEGAARVERHEPLARWRGRMGRAGFRPAHLGSNAFKQASMLLTLFSEEGYCVEEVDGCLTLGWHSRPLISASAWRADDLDAEAVAGEEEDEHHVAPLPVLPATPVAQQHNSNSNGPSYNSIVHNNNKGDNNTGGGGSGGGNSSSSTNNGNNHNGNLSSNSSAWSSSSGSGNNNATTACSTSSSNNHHCRQMRII